MKMSEKITYGIKNVYYVPITESGGTVVYGTPKAWPGATEIALPPVGEAGKKVYADNVTYLKLHTNQGYAGTLSVFNVPDDFAKNHLGVVEDANGVLVEDANALHADFALMFEFDTDTTKTKRNVLYRCSAGRTNINGVTKRETIDPTPIQIPITAEPATDTEYVKATILGGSTDDTWANWFSSVYTPSLTAQYLVTVTIDDGSAPAEAISGALVVCGTKFALTDASGNAYFTMPAGTYDILVSADGYVADTDSAVVSTAAVDKTISMVSA